MLEDLLSPTIRFAEIACRETRGRHYSPSFSLRGLGPLSGSITGLFTSGPGSSGFGPTGSGYGSCGSGSRGGKGGSLGSGIDSLLQSFWGPPRGEGLGSGVQSNIENGWKYDDSRQATPAWPLCFTPAPAFSRMPACGGGQIGESKAHNASWLSRAAICLRSAARSARCFSRTNIRMKIAPTMAPASAYNIFVLLSGRRIEKDPPILSETFMLRRHNLTSWSVRALTAEMQPSWVPFECQ